MTVEGTKRKQLIAEIKEYISTNITRKNDQLIQCEGNHCDYTLRYSVITDRVFVIYGQSIGDTVLELGHTYNIGYMCEWDLNTVLGDLEEGRYKLL